MTTQPSTMSPRRTASIIAGVGLLAMAVLAPIALFGAITPALTAGDATQVANAIQQAEPSFRAGIAALVVVAILDVIVAGALFVFFEPVSRTISMVAAWFRLAYSAVFVVAIAQLAIGVSLVSNPDAALMTVGSFNTIWQFSLIFFAVHLLLLGYLGWRSPFMHKVFAILLLLAGLGYLVDGFGQLLSADYSISVAGFTFVGEVVLIFWLFIRGGRAAKVAVTTAPDAKASATE